MWAEANGNPAVIGYCDRSAAALELLERSLNTVWWRAVATLVRLASRLSEPWT